MWNTQKRFHKEGGENKMAKGSRGGKRAKRASNAKYNGFSITDEKREHKSLYSYWRKNLDGNTKKCAWGFGTLF